MQAEFAEKFVGDPDIENIEKEGGIFFNPTEWKYFLLEIDDMRKSGKKIDFSRAVHNSRYLAKIDKATEEMDAGHWVEHDLIEVEDDDEQTLA